MPTPRPTLSRGPEVGRALPDPSAFSSSSPTSHQRNPLQPQVGNSLPRPSTFSSSSTPPQPPRRPTDLTPSFSSSSAYFLPASHSSQSSIPGFFFSACAHYSPQKPLNFTQIPYPSTLQTTYPCLCNACDFSACLHDGASVRQLWFDVALPRYRFLIELGEAAVRPPQGPNSRHQQGVVPRQRSEYSWVDPVLAEAKWVREEQGRRVLEFVRGLIRDFGARWGKEEEERLREELRRGDGV